MTFERTKSGQENRALFLGVDIVCYVEGEHGSARFSEDSYFWSKVFSACTPELRIKFEPRGGKPILENLAKNIISENIANTIVAMDADYDQILNQKIEDHRIFYTYGYSWENDVYNIENMISAIKAILYMTNEIPEDALTNIRKMHEDIMRRMKWPVRADFLAIQSKSSLLPRDKPGKIIEENRGEKKIKLNEILNNCKSIKEKRNRCRNSIAGLRDIRRYCVGHIYAYICIQIIKIFIKAIKHKNSSNSTHIQSISIIEFEKFLARNKDEISHYYKDMCREYENMRELSKNIIRN